MQVSDVAWSCTLPDSAEQDIGKLSACAPSYNCWFLVQNPGQVGFDK